LQVTQLTCKAGRARTCTQTAVDALTIFSGATEVHVLWLSAAQHPTHMEPGEISTAGTGSSRTAQGGLNGVVIPVGINFPNSHL